MDFEEEEDLSSYWITRSVEDTIKKISELNRKDVNVYEIIK